MCKPSRFLILEGLHSKRKEQSFNKLKSSIRGEGLQAQQFYNVNQNYVDHEIQKN